MFRVVAAAVADENADTGDATQQHARHAAAGTVIEAETILTAWL